MKLHYRYGIGSLRGKLLGLILSEWKKTKQAYCRELTKPKTTGQHVKFKNAKQNIGAIWRTCSSEFKDDLRKYSRARIDYYSPDEIPVYGYYAYFIKFLYRFSNDHPDIDLNTITKEELQMKGCPVSVKDMVDERYLPVIENAFELVNEW